MSVNLQNTFLLQLSCTGILYSRHIEGLNAYLQPAQPVTSLKAQASMHKSELETLIKARGREFFEIISDERHLLYSTKAGGQEN